MRAISVIVLSVCSPIFAHCASICPHEPLPPPPTPPCPPPKPVCRVACEGFGSLLDLQANGSNFYYAAEAFPYDLSIADPPVSPNWQIFEIDPGFHPAFEVGVKCLFLQKNMKIEFSWEGFSGRDRAAMHVVPLDYATGNMVGPIFDIGPNSSAYTAAQGEAISQFNAVNLVVGKTIHFEKEFIMSLDLGLSFAQIKKNATAIYDNAGSATSRIIFSGSSYFGVGPQFVLNLDYRICKRLYLTGSSSWSMYAGRINNVAKYQSFAPGLATIGVAEPNTQQTKVPTRSQLIPGFDERIGLTYTPSCFKSNLSISAGYVFQIYLNAVQSMDMLTQAVPGFDPGNLPPLAVFALTFNRTLSNFMLSGPYVSFSLRY